MNPEALVERTVALGPRLSDVVQRHLEENGELLLHLLVSDLRRWAVSTFYNREADDEVQALLGVMDDALRTGDEAVVNAVAVSFVEDACTWDDRMSPFVALWPAALREEVVRQQAAR